MEDAECDTDVASALSRVSSSLGSLRRIESALVLDKDKPVVHARLQVAFNHKHSQAIDRAIHDVIVAHGLHSEKLGPGGFDLCLARTLERLTATSGHCGPPVEVPPPVPHSASAADVEKIVDKFAGHAGKQVTAMLRRALELAGYGGRIIVEKTSSQVPSVELVRGYTFDLEPILPIDASFVHPRVFCIDGYIESVSEVHHLLEAAAEAREPCVVFVRGVSDDVKQTLKANYDRGSLRVLPLSAKFDLDGMNTLVDIAVVSGADLVSSLKGDLISSVKFHEAPVVDQITVFRGRTVIAHSLTHARVASHVDGLKRRRRDEAVDEKGKLLDKRIKSLSPNHVIVRLPGDKDFVVRSQAIDSALRAIKSAVDYGVTAEGGLVATEIAARVHADRCAKTLLELGAHVAR